MMATIPAGDSASLATAVAAVRRDVALRSICSSADFDGPMDRSQMDSAEVIVFQEFNIAVFKGDPDRRLAVANSARSQGMIVEPEYWNHPLGMQSGPANVDGERAIGPTLASLDYLRGYRDGITRAIESLESPPLGAGGAIGPADFSDSLAATWGLQATGVTSATRTGAGVRVAVLDTGFDITHPDFVGRGITSESFIPPTATDRSGNVIALNDRSATVDKSGHGTHCIGTACGPLLPPSGRRYGIAHGAEIFNGKVLSVIPGDPKAAGADAWIISGIHWAIQNGCSIISLSLGSPVAPGGTFSTAYETLAKAAWDNGVLIIAAAGNDSDRDGRYPPFFRRSILPVARPANSPHIVAVAAVEPATLTGGALKIANFSNRHMVDDGGEINLSGPGVSILSSYTQPRHHLLDGTSQATPHVAGIAALVQEETGKKGKDLYLELRSRAVAQGSRLDYGSGLVHV
jgi:subtilisin family serine protease